MSRINAGMKDNRIKRLMSALIVMLLIFAVVRCSFGVIAATGYADVTVQHDGRTVKSVTVIEGHKETITAVRPSSIDMCDYQWQVRTADGLWVGIYEQTSETLEVSDAVLGSVLDEAGSAYVRCKVVSGDLELASDAVKVTIAFEEKSDSTDGAAYVFGDEYAVDSTGNSEDAAEIQEESTEYEVSIAPATASDAAADNETAANDVSDIISEDQVLVYDAADTPFPASEETDIYTVKINYLDAVTQNSIYEPYSATIASGSTFSQTITMPTYIGYATYYKPNDWSTTASYTTGSDGTKTAIDPTTDAGWTQVTKLSLNFTVEKDTVINVYFFASNVSWKANYFFQNIYDDNYTRMDQYTKSGMAKTGTIVSDEELERDVTAEGFTALYHYPEAVAADGSTVFECYYDRNYYLIKFDLDGGHGVDPIYARYETPYLVNDPTRYGYRFAGWYEGTANDNGVVTYDETHTVSIPSTIGTSNKYYKAKWEKTEVSYTVVYWKQNADDDSYSYWSSEERKANVEDSITASGLTYTETLKSGSAVSNSTYPQYKNEQGDGSFTDYIYFTYDEERTNKDGKHQISGDNSTVVNVFYSRKEYTLRFYYARSKTENEATTYGICANTTLMACKNYGHDTYVDTDNSTSSNIRNKFENTGVDWGTANDKPGYTLNAEQKKWQEKGKFAVGSDNFGDEAGWTYYYLEIKARYDADISKVWPRDCINSVSVSNANFGSTSYFSAWNVEYKTNYAKENANKTIKGNYQKLDSTLLYNLYAGDGYSATKDSGMTKNEAARATEDSSTIVFLGFWENAGDTTGTGVGDWNKAKTWIYKTWLPLLDENETDYKDFDSDDADSYVIYTYDNVDYKYAKYKTYDGVKYYLADVYFSFDDSDIGGQTQTSLEGYTTKTKVLGGSYATGESDSEGNTYTNSHGTYINDCYYTRKFYSFGFQNYGVQTNKLDIPYETKLGSYSPDESITYTSGSTSETKSLQEFFSNPTYPTTLEAGAYEFEGWYTTPTHSEGTKVTADELTSGSDTKWSEYTMPANNVLLYAKWTPIEHNVTMFVTYDYMLEFEEEVATGADADELRVTYKNQGKIQEYKAISHGSVYGSVDNPKYTDDTGTELTFSGWFYMKDGEKKAYTPLDMPINEDMNVFADWGSHSPQPYMVHYAKYYKETDSKVISSLKEASGAAPAENREYTVSVNGAAVSYIYTSGGDGEGYHELVAADTNGYAYQGSTKTFSAKAGDSYNQLYSKYNSGYFPTTATHSITMKYEENKLQANENVYTFYYVNVNSVSYTVKYINKETNTSVFEDKNGSLKTVDDKKETTTKCVVTERFKVIDGYVPDAFYKRLILAVQLDDDGKTWVGSDENLITFYYTENDAAAYYAVHFMLEDIDAEAAAIEFDSNGMFTGNGYTESDQKIEGIATVDSSTGEGSEVITPYTFAGFKLKANGDSYEPCTVVQTKENSGEYSYDVSTSPYSGGAYTVTVNNHGTDIYIFYERQKYDYTVYYLENGAIINSYMDLLDMKEKNVGGVLKDAKTVSDIDFGKTVTETAADITGYTCTTATTMTLTVGTVSDADKENGYTPNYLIFYYVPNSYTIEYKIVHDDEGVVSSDEYGTLSKRSVTIDGDEFGNMDTDRLDSKAVAATAYKLEGWYLDEECTIPADTQYTDDGDYSYAEILDDGLTIRPNKERLVTSPGTNTFYAKFVKGYGKLTIVRSGASDESAGTQVFVYEIKNKATGDIIVVTITGDGSKDIDNLPYGDYEIRQVNSWSWRYADAVQSVTVTNGSASQSVTFSDAADNESWLSGESDAIKNVHE